MALKILLADKDSKWREKLALGFSAGHFETSEYYDGKMLQVKIATEKVFAVVMNLDLETYNGIQVLKYIKVSNPQVKVLMISDNKEAILDFNLTPEMIKKMGSIGIFEKTTPIQKIISLIDDYIDHAQFLKKQESDEKTGDNETPLTISDEKFTRIKIDELFTGSSLVFDIYIRLSKNKFLKLFHQGELFNEGRLKKYIENKTGYLYFLTSDRRFYMQFMNDLASKVVSRSTIQTEVKIQLMKNVVEKFVEEAYTVGLKPSLLEYSKTICENVYQTVKTSPDLFLILRDFHAIDESEYTHSFASAFFSVMILKQFSWQTPKTIEIMVLGALFHDIGLMKISEEIRKTPYGMLNQKNKEIYETHCEVGVSLLPDNVLITAPVKQIILQHHEISDGSGYPSQLTDHKIFPMAKILSLVNYFSETMIEKKMLPVDALRIIFRDPQIRIKYNQEVMVALAKIFIDPQNARGF